jgi:alkyldihydroxyacetonephosphate synthase
VTAARDALRWNGWGRLGESFHLSREREAFLTERLARRLGRLPPEVPPPQRIDELRLAPGKLPSDVLRALRAACGDGGVCTSALERVTHALGKSLPDLLRLRRGEIDCAPDAVVYPPDEGAVATVLRIAADAHVAVVPFGGGSSVVGGVEPRPARGQSGALSLDTTRLDRLLRLDVESRTATFQAGIDGPALEAALRERGFTLGHYPQSFEHSTLGGWVAARSSGQQSNAYGGIEKLLVAVRMVTPEGVVRTLAVPRSATGPDLAALALGSEGTLGVITEATLRISPLPARIEERGMLFRSFAEGAAAVRACVQERLPLSMLRLADGEETGLGELLRHDPARRFDAVAWVLRGAARLGYRAGRALLLMGAEGGARDVGRALARARAIGRSHGGLPLGRAPGRSWRRDRFRTPYLRDWLLDHGVAADTFETALPWSRLLAGHESILRASRAALEAHAGGGIAMGHLSHSYADGACLYFTVLYALDPDDPLGQWHAIKRAATDAVVAAGGTLSHHHGIGSDHAAWLAHEKGTLGVDALRALKHGLDPRGVMNPGKLL